jgi:hypothetical protein
MTKQNYSERNYLLSDTYGGQKEWDPFTAQDIDAIITTDIRSGLPAQGKFDIFGAKALTGHLLRAAVNLHDENPGIGQTGIFINSAPRTEEGVNGQPFYRAETDNGLVIVATPKEVLSAIKNRITNLLHLPNKDNELYGNDEQFRSSFTPRLLAENHGLNLVENDLDEIPDEPEGIKLAYIDRFGNLVIYENPAGTISNLSDEIRVQIGKVSKKVLVDESLGQAPSGRLITFPNDRNTEIMSKWSPQWSAAERLKKSAYQKFNQPKIGAPVYID